MIECPNCLYELNETELMILETEGYFFVLIVMRKFLMTRDVFIDRINGSPIMLSEVAYEMTLVENDERIRQIGELYLLSEDLLNEKLEELGIELG